MRRCESVDTADIMLGFEGQYEVLYVQFPMGSVLIESFLAGDHWRQNSVSIGRRVRSRGGGNGNISTAHNLDGAVPRAGGKGVFRDGTPRHGECLALVFVEVHDGEVGHVGVVQLDRAIAAGREQLVLVDLGPGEVILGIVGVEASDKGRPVSSVQLLQVGIGRSTYVLSTCMPFGPSPRQNSRPLPTMP